jgi:hypothetical protein
MDNAGHAAFETLKLIELRLMGYPDLSVETTV